MSRTIAALLIATIMLSTTRAAAAAADMQAPAMASRATDLHAYVSRLPPGSTVKVTPKEGRSFKAILMVVDDEAIVVKPKTRLSRPERRMALNEVEFVELQEKNGSSVAKTVGIGIATGVGAFLGLLVVTFALISD